VSAPLCDESRSHLDRARRLLSRLAARVGKAKAITATARKLAVLVYRVLSGNLVYNDPGATAYHQLNRARQLKSLRKRAKLLGFELVDRSSGEVLLNPVS
jgi:transposase